MWNDSIYTLNLFLVNLDRYIYIYILEVSFLRDLKISVDSLIMDKSKLNFLDS